MKRSKLSDEQILAIVKRRRGGPESEVCRTNGITEQTYYRCKAKFGGVVRSEMQRLEHENRRLKHIVAEQMPDIHALKAAVGKSNAKRVTMGGWSTRASRLSGVPAAF